MGKKGGTISAWKQVKNEGTKAFEAFRAYRDMGENRSLAKVAEKLGKSETLISRWSSRNKWQERIQLYNSEIERETKAEVIKERKKMIDRHIRIAQQIQGKALKALQILEPEEMTARDIKEFIKIGTELEKMNREINLDEKEEYIYKMEIENLDDVEEDIYGED